MAASLTACNFDLVYVTLASMYVCSNYDWVSVSVETNACLFVLNQLFCLKLFPNFFFLGHFLSLFWISIFFVYFISERI